MKNIDPDQPVEANGSTPNRFVWIAWGVGICLVVIGSFIPHAPVVPESDSFAGLDKLARVLGFGLVSFFPVAFFYSLGLGVVMGLSMIPLGFSLEYVQKLIPGRSFSPQDMIANNIGTLIGICAALIIRLVVIRGKRPVKKDKNPEK